MYVLGPWPWPIGLNHSCPWPQEGLSSKSRCLALASDFFSSPWPQRLCPRLHLCRIVQSSHYCTSLAYLGNQLFVLPSVTCESNPKILELLYLNSLVPILTYGHESWITTERVQSQVQASKMRRFLRRIEGVTLFNEAHSYDI